MAHALQCHQVPGRPDYQQEDYHPCLLFNPWPCLGGHQLCQISGCSYWLQTVLQHSRWHHQQKSQVHQGRLLLQSEPHQPESKRSCLHHLYSANWWICSFFMGPSHPDTKKIEKVQRSSARFVMGDHRRTSSVTAMLNHLDWPCLEEHRYHSRLQMMYKIRNNLVDIPWRSYLSYLHPPERTATDSQYLTQTLQRMPARTSQEPSGTRTILLRSSCIPIPRVLDTFKSAVRYLRLK